MTDSNTEEPEAHLRPQRWIAWVWIVPLAAISIVLWLAWRALADRGPEITVSFKTVQGLQAGQSTIQHRSVVVGTIDSLELTPDMSTVLVHARMTRAVESNLTDSARFYAVTPRVSAEGISGLSTLVSGSYIEMNPGKPGAAVRRDFVGLEEPPVLQPDTPGRSFLLEASDLGSLTRGSPISFRGMTIGEVDGYSLDADSERVKVTAFIHAPFDRLVHPESRFWNAGGIDLTIGADGVRVRANSWQQLLAGGIELGTPTVALAGTPSGSGAVFQLYDDRQQAERDPHGPEIVYIADFTGNLRGLASGTVVELQGIEVGKVRASKLRYDEHDHSLLTRVTFAIDSSRIQILDMPDPENTDTREAAAQALDKLVSQGLRAQVATISYITGQKIIALDVLHNTPRARLEHVGDFVKFPSVSSGDITEILQSLRGILRNVDRATSGPDLQHAVKSLDDMVTRLDHLTKDSEPDLRSLVKSLREVSESAQSTLTSVQGMIGTNGSNNSELPQLMRELTDAARSVKGLADYLDRHPESLLRGRKGDEQ